MRGDEGLIPHKDQRTAIVNSVEKLMGTVVDFSGVNESLKKLKYTDKYGNEIYFKIENLLSASILEPKTKLSVILTNF